MFSSYKKFNLEFEKCPIAERFNNLACLSLLSINKIEMGGGRKKEKPPTLLNGKK